MKFKLLETILNLYALLFSRRIFYKLNRFILLLGLRGVGILNFKSDKSSGEEAFLIGNFSKGANGVILDVGANIGNYSKRLKLLNPELQLYCFEPHPRTFQKLMANVDPLAIKTFNLGVGSANGVLKLYDYESGDGSEHASLYKDVIEQLHKGKAVEHAVEIITLDEFALEYEFDRVLLLKIDTEGHELEVLKGFEDFIRQNKVDIIHFEFNEMNVVSKVFFKDFWDFLPHYDFYRLVRDGLVPINNYNPSVCEIFAYQNIVAKLKPKFRFNS